MKNTWPVSGGLRYFLVASLGLHLILLLGLDAEHPPALPQSTSILPLKAVLTNSGQGGSSPIRQIDKPPEWPPHAKPFAAGVEKHGKQPLAEAEVSMPGGGATQRQEIPAGAGAEAGVADPAAPPSLLQERPSADAVRQYLLLLVPEARRLKHYPVPARERGWEGTAEITVKLSKVQVEPAIVMTRSSGFPILDEEAMAIIGRAVRLVEVPAPLRGKDVAIPVALRFSLQD